MFSDDYGLWNTGQWWVGFPAFDLQLPALSVVTSPVECRCFLEIGLSSPGGTDPGPVIGSNVASDLRTLVFVAML